MRGRRLLAAAAAAALTLGAAGCSSHDTAAPAQAADAAMPMAMPGMNMSAFDGDGRSATVAGYTLSDLHGPQRAGKAGTLSFVITGPGGKPQTDFTLQQTKLLHLYLVRADLTGFQHVHPTLDQATGRWSVPLTIAAPGPYRVVAEFEALRPDGWFDDRILGSDLRVAGAYHPVPYRPATGTAAVAGYTVALDPSARIHGPELHLRVTQGGHDVRDLQQYLQSWAHVTGFRKGDLTAVHVHPDENPPKADPNALGGPALTLASLFTVPGDYRLFVEFQTAGTLHQVPIDIQVG